MFNGLQKALFTEALANTDDDEKSDAKKRKEQEKRQSKYLDVANGMISSYLRGTGVRGNVISTLKDMGLEVYKQQGKTVQDYDRVADAALGFSPPLRYKYIQMKSAGRKFTYPGSREEIMNKVWGNDVIVGDRTIDVHIRKLRKKLGDQHIQTIKGVGYRFQA